MASHCTITSPWKQDLYLPGLFVHKYSWKDPLKQILFVLAKSISAYMACSYAKAPQRTVSQYCFPMSATVVIVSSVFFQMRKWGLRACVSRIPNFKGQGLGELKAWAIPLVPRNMTIKHSLWPMIDPLHHRDLYLGRWNQRLFSALPEEYGEDRWIPEQH